MVHNNSEHNNGSFTDMFHRSQKVGKWPPSLSDPTVPLSPISPTKPYPFWNDPGFSAVQWQNETIICQVVPGENDTSLFVFEQYFKISYDVMYVSVSLKHLSYKNMWNN